MVGGSGRTGKSKGFDKSSKRGSMDKETTFRCGALGILEARGEPNRLAALGARCAFGLAHHRYHWQEQAPPQPERGQALCSQAAGARVSETWRSKSVCASACNTTSTSITLDPSHPFPSTLSPLHHPLSALHRFSHSLIIARVTPLCSSLSLLLLLNLWSIPQEKSRSYVKGFVHPPNFSRCFAQPNIPSRSSSVVIATVL